MRATQFLVVLNTQSEELNPDAKAFLMAIGVNDPTITAAINTLVNQLQAAGLWTKMDLIYPFVGGTASKHSYNLKNPATFQIIWGGATPPTHDANGVTGTGAGSGETGYAIPPANQNNIHICAYIRNNVNSLAVMGAVDVRVNKYTQLYPRSSNTFYCDMNDGSGLGVSNTDSRGFYVGNRVSSTENTQYKNGVLINTQSVVSDVPATTTMGLCCRKDFIGFSKYSTYNLAFISVGTGLTPSDIATFDTINLTFQTSLSRNV